MKPFLGAGGPGPRRRRGRGTQTEPFTLELPFFPSTPSSATTHVHGSSFTLPHPGAFRSALSLWTPCSRWTPPLPPGTGQTHLKQCLVSPGTGPDVEGTTHRSEECRGTPLVVTR